MSYLAMSAATIDGGNNDLSLKQQEGSQAIQKKRQSHNRTQKSRSDVDQEKVNSVLQSIHNSYTDDDDLGNYNPAKHSDNFKPLNPFDNFVAPAVPSPGLKGQGQGQGQKEAMSNLVPQPMANDALQTSELQQAFMNEAQVRDYYRRLNRPFNPDQLPTSSTAGIGSMTPMSDNQALIEKLNYMINLLEEQQDEKTGNVAEEVILYSFLGVFIIFVVDSFTKIGKYVR